VSDDESKAALALIPVYSVWMNALIVRFFLRKVDAHFFAQELEVHQSAVSAGKVKRVTIRDTNSYADGVPTAG